MQKVKTIFKAGMKVEYIGPSFVRISNNNIDGWSVFDADGGGRSTEKIENYRKVNNWIKL